MCPMSIEWKLKSQKETVVVWCQLNIQSEVKLYVQHTLLFGEIKQLGMDIEGLENREASLDIWLKIRIPKKEALHEKDPNPKGYDRLNANAGLET
ncbi:hypothetical protein Peur_028109 [Populus x canadensis]